ncbi:hypothetical protein GH714_030383 [Hevea brasiliensis]|uniref:Uncharacterized protein n=1 Tax=Hevea brasiliensis TaxID=3981 RepID=A0A6A6LSE0_HEVBR|nr:hypothetical protein GH714_030383 [Hevea brasiliensis]
MDGQSERTIQTPETCFACVFWILEVNGMISYLGRVCLQQQLSFQHRDGTYEALYGRKCRSPLFWIEMGEAKVHDIDLVQYTSEIVSLIRERLKITFSRQKSYVDPRRRDVEFAVGDYVFLKVSPMKGVMRFGKRGKYLQFSEIQRLPRFVNFGQGKQATKKVLELGRDFSYPTVIRHPKRVPEVGIGIGEPG